MRFMSTLGVVLGILGVLVACESRGPKGVTVGPQTPVATQQQTTSGNQTGISTTPVSPTTSTSGVWDGKTDVANSQWLVIDGAP